MAGLDGNFMGGLARGFSRVWQAKDEKESRDKMAKLQGQLVELQLKATQNQQGAFDKLTGMASGSVGPIETRGTKEIGGRQAPNLQFTGKPGMSLTEILADPEGQIAALQSGLAKVGDFAQKPAELPSDLQMFAAAGIDPKSPEGRQAILNRVGGTTKDDSVMESLQAQIELFRLDELRRTRATEEKTAAQSVANTRIAVRNDFHHAKEIIGLQKELEDTALQSGVPYGDFMRDLQAGGAAVAQALGFDVSRTRQLLEKRDRLNKLFADGVIESIDRFAESGTLTNDKFNALQKATPNINNSPGANALLLADRMQAALDAADIEGLEIDGRDEIEAFIASSRAPKDPSKTDPVVDVPAAARNVSAAAGDVATMTLEQLQQLAKDGQALSEEVREAAARRWEELKNASR